MEGLVRNVTVSKFRNILLCIDFVWYVCLFVWIALFNWVNIVRTSCAHVDYIYLVFVKYIKILCHSRSFSYVSMCKKLRQIYLRKSEICLLLLLLLLFVNESISFQYINTFEELLWWTIEQFKIELLQCACFCSYSLMKILFHFILFRIGFFPQIVDALILY